MGHICWLAGNMYLVGMPGVPKEPGKWGTFLRTRLFAFSLCSRGELWQLTCNLSPPTIQLPARYLPQTSHLKGLGSLSSVPYPVLQELLRPLPFVFLSLLLNHSSPGLLLYKSIPDL